MFRIQRVSALFKCSISRYVTHIGDVRTPVSCVYSRACLPINLHIKNRSTVGDFSFFSGRADVTCWLYMPRPCGRTRITLVVTGVEMASPSRNGPANPRISGTWHLQLPRSRTSVDVAEVEDQIAIDTRLQI